MSGYDRRERQEVAIDGEAGPHQVEPRLRAAGQGRAVGDMPDRNLDAHLFSLREGISKKPHLKVSLRTVHHLGRCKMAEHTFEKNVRRRLNGLQYRRKAGSINTQMVQAG